MRSFCSLQHHHHVAVLEAFAHVVEHPYAERLYAGRQQRLRAITRTSGAPSVVSPWISERATRR